MRRASASIVQRRINLSIFRVKSLVGRLHVRATALEEETEQADVSLRPAYSVYKSTGALSMKVIRPRWSRSRSGGSLYLDKPGVLYLEFAKGLGQRVYDWENKETIALSVTELGTILESLPGKGASFFHDPYKMSQGEGTITKQFSVERGTPERGGYYLNLNVNRKGQETTRLAVSLTDGEYGVFKSLAQFLIPRLLGFDEVFRYPIDIAPSDSTDNGSPPSGSL